jgi:hypothetical protein
MSGQRCRSGLDNAANLRHVGLHRALGAQPYAPDGARRRSVRVGQFLHLGLAAVCRPGYGGCRRIHCAAGCRRPGSRGCSARRIAVVCRGLQNRGQKAPWLQPGDAWPTPSKRRTVVLYRAQARRPNSPGRRAPRTHHATGARCTWPCWSEAGCHRSALRRRSAGGRVACDGPGASAPNGEALIPKAKATEGERISISRLHAGESQWRASARSCSNRVKGTLVPWAIEWVGEVVRVIGFTTASRNSLAPTIVGLILSRPIALYVSWRMGS